MPKWYRLNTSGAWTALKGVYRLNTSGAWTPIKGIYRLNTSGSWQLVHTSQEVVGVTTAPTLLNQISSPDTFYGGDTLTLTRGVYTNVTADANTTYRMTIYSSANATAAVSTWTPVTQQTFTGANSTGTTTITASVTDQNAKDKLYFVGEVRINNDANTPGSTPVDVETPNKVLSRISFDTTSFTVNKTSTSATFAWTVTGVTDNTFLYQDAANSASVVRITRADNSAFVLDAPAGVGSLNGTATTVGYGTLVSGVGYRADLIIRGNDGWATNVNFTKNNKGAATLNQTYVTFTTPGPEPINTVAPVISPLNNRSRVPVNTQLTATQGTWTNVNASTVYEYQWTYSDGNVPTTTGWSTSNTLASIPTSYATNGDVLVKVRATNTDGGNTTAQSTGYLLDPLPTITAATPTSATRNVATNFSFTINGYPTAYSIDWTNDGTIDFNQPTITAGTASVAVTRSNTYTTSGTPTLRVVAQPGGVTRDTVITVTAPTPTGSGFARTDATATPSQPSTITFTTSNNQVTSSWTNGTPLSTGSVRFQGSGVGVTKDITDTTSPFITSDISSYTSSGTYTGTVTNTNTDLVVNCSWNQTNTASYKIDFSSSVYGNDVAIGNNSGSSVSANVPFFGGGTFTWTGLTLYESANQLGASTFYSNPVAGGLTPTSKSSSRTNTTSVTYVPPNVAPFNGNVVISKLSGPSASGSVPAGTLSSARWGDVYYVSTATASGTPSPSILSYQWQRYNALADTWNAVSGATTSQFTVDSSHTGANFRCVVTFTNGVSPDLATPSNTLVVANPTVTGITSYYYSTASRTATKANGYPQRPPGTGGTFFVVWYVEGYNMQGMNSKTVLNGTVQTSPVSTASDALNIYSFSQTIGDGTSYSGGIYRNTGAAAAAPGNSVALRVQPTSGAQGTGITGFAYQTNAVTNNTTSQTGSPITNSISQVTF